MKYWTQEEVHKKFSLWLWTLWPCVLHPHLETSCVYTSNMDAPWNDPNTLCLFKHQTLFHFLQNGKRRNRCSLTKQTFFVSLFFFLSLSNVDLHYLRSPLARVKLQAQLATYRRRKPDDMFITWGALNLVPSLSSFKTSPQTRGAFYVGHSRPWAMPLECHSDVGTCEGIRICSE